MTTPEADPAIPEFERVARRVLERDDLLHVAHDAEAAIGIVRQDDRRGQTSFSEPELFAKALSRHLQGSHDAESWAVRSQHFSRAAAIVRFCSMVGIETDHNSVALHELAAAELQINGHRLDREATTSEDLTLGVIGRYQLVRDLRLDGRPAEAVTLAQQDDSYFFGSGAEPHRGQFEFEVGAGLLALGNHAQTFAALRESNEYWASDHVSAWPSRSRFDFALALSALAGADTDTSTERLDSALRQLRATRKGRTLHYVEELSLVLAQAELIALQSSRHQLQPQAIELIHRATSIVENIRARWRVVTRSRSPLSIAFRRIYGDIALLVSGLTDDRAGRLGLRVALSAKQTGFAGLMRAGRSIASEHVRALVDEIVEVETQLEDSDVGAGSNEGRLYSHLDGLREELEDSVSPLLADFVLPGSTDVQSVIEKIGNRFVLDYVELPHIDGLLGWYRSAIVPDGTVEFSRVVLGDCCELFLHGDNGRDPLVDDLGHETNADQAIWRGLATELLPAGLLDRLTTADRDNPIELLISPHSELGFIPWAALAIDDQGTRLVEHAVVTQTPVLSCISSDEVATVVGPALVKLVGEPKGVDIDAECSAWGIRPEGDRTPLVRCELANGSTAVVMTGTLTSALARAADTYGFVHIAAHGTGSGLSQSIAVPERLTAGHALGLRWPGAVLLAACHAGRVDNIDDAEPLGFVIALLCGGAHSVVAGLHAVSDHGTGIIGADIVRDLRPGDRLDRKLRDAQLMLIDRKVVEWGLLAVFVR